MTPYATCRVPLKVSAPTVIPVCDHWNRSKTEVLSPQDRQTRIQRQTNISSATAADKNFLNKGVSVNFRAHSLLHNRFYRPPLRETFLKKILNIPIDSNWKYFFRVTLKNSEANTSPVWWYYKSICFYEWENLGFKAKSPLLGWRLARRRKRRRPSVVSVSNAYSLTPLRAFSALWEKKSTTGWCIIDSSSRELWAQLF